MKSKLLVILSTFVMALGLLAQNATPAPSAPSADQKQACACCNHDHDGGKMACCGKDGCCQGGKCEHKSADSKAATMSHDDMMAKDADAGAKCPMMAHHHDGTMSCCGKDGGCCKEGKCAMAEGAKTCCDGKSCCGGKCEQHAAGM